MAPSPAPVHWLVVAAEPVTSVDVTAADTLAELEVTLPPPGRFPASLAESMILSKKSSKRFARSSQFGEDKFFPTIGAAVSSYLDSHAVDRVDREDRNPM